jgi:dienelactone hydrolase
VVLVHGSGANDRDETIGPNKPFKDLAWGLASRGIAVLRYEKRTLHYAQQMAEEFFSFTAWDETIHDAVLAADRLRQDSRIDPLQIYVLGHSLGGYLAPRIGQMDPRLAGLIILAGGTRPLEEAFIEQITYIRSLETEQSEVIPQTETWLRQAERIRSLTPADSSAKLRLMGASPVYWLDLKEYDPPALAASLSVPILILQGKRDYQVTLEDFGRWKSALGNDSRVRFRLYSQLNHLFISGQGRITPAEYQNAGHVSLNVVEDITAWIRDPEKH